MSEQNIYKELYDLQQIAANQHQSLQNVYSALYPLVSPQGVQLTLQEVIELVVHALSKESEQILDKDEQVASEAHAVVKDEPVDQE